MCGLLWKRCRPASRAMLFKEYRGLCTTIGNRVQADTKSGKITGVAADITLSGALVLVDESGQRHEVVDANLRYV